MSFEFTSLCLVMGTAFCNVSVFYSFYHYLGTIDIPVPWRGFLLGLEPMSAFALRLLLLPWLTVRNALNLILIALLLLIGVSCAYLEVTTVPGMIVLRIIHGGVFVLLTSAVIALLVHFIPPDKSGQGFSALSIASMIPYALMPPLSEALLPYVRSEADIYAVVSVFSAAAILILLAVRGRIGNALRAMDGVLMQRPRLAAVRANLRHRSVALLLLATLLVYLAHATFFYFLKDLSLQIGGGDVGLFFTASMVVMIAVRAAGTRFFDRLNKLAALQKVLVLLLPCVILLPHVSSPIPYYLLAALYGFCMGVILPLLNALLFSASPPALRGLNTNLTLFTMDMAYFLMPYVGGAIISSGAQFSLLFYIGAGFVMLTLGLTAALVRQSRKEGLCAAPGPYS